METCLFVSKCMENPGYVSNDTGFHISVRWILGVGQIIAAAWNKSRLPKEKLNCPLWSGSISRFLLSKGGQKVKLVQKKANAILFLQFTQNM